jgi:calcineurin-like phosphoesterase family protein
MNYFFTSDEHLDHPGIMTHSPGPFASLEERNEFIVASHNERVKANDRVYMIGDVAWKNHKQWVDRLNGHKILIVGNHDKMNVEGLSAFQEVYDICRIQLNKQKIIMCHFPMESWWGKGGDAWMLHGHTHNIKLITNKKIYVGVDGRRDFAPWSLEELKEIMDELPKF